MPVSEWLRCCLAFIHVRNRLPNMACCEKNMTPYEAFHGVEVPQLELISHFKTIGCLCYKILPFNLRHKKPKLSDRSVLLGYADELGQKG